MRTQYHAHATTAESCFCHHTVIVIMDFNHSNIKPRSFFTYGIVSCQIFQCGKRKVNNADR